MRHYKNTLITVNVLLLLTYWGVAATVLYYYYKLHQCEKKNSSGCPRPTCAIEDEKCNGLPFYIDKQGNKICVDRSFYFEAHS